MKKSAKKLLLRILIISLFFVEFLPNYFLLASLSKNPNQFQYQKDLAATLNWIKNNTEENTVIIQEWGSAHPTVGIAERRVIVTSKAYPSEVQMLAERYKDLARFFLATNSDDALKIAAKYNASYVFLNKNSFNYNICWYIGICDTFMVNEKTSESAMNNFLFKKLQNHENIAHFQLLYESPNFIIYKVVA